MQCDEPFGKHPCPACDNARLLRLRCCVCWPHCPQDLVYKHADSGILKFAPVDQVLAAALPGAGKPAAQVDRSFKLL